VTALQGLAPEVELTDLVIGTSAVSVDVAQAVTSATLDRKLDGPATVDLVCSDPKRRLLGSPLFSERSTLRLDGMLFVLTKVTKQGSQVTFLFEDAAAADLRLETKPQQAAAGTTTRGEFLRRLVGSVGWVEAEVETGSQILDTIGTGTGEDEEDYWTATGRLAGEIGWRRFASANRIIIGSDAWLMARREAFRIVEHRDGVDSIDFDFDARKPAGTASVSCRVDRWEAPPGSPVEIAAAGPGSGHYLVSSIERSLFSKQATVELVREHPALPEPKPEPAPDPEVYGVDGADLGGLDMGGLDVGDGGGLTPVGSVAGGSGAAPSARGLIWPVSGRASSEFGARGGRHQGLDLAAPTGRPIIAAAAGTVSRADFSASYGNVVYIDHGGGMQTRYAHMVRRPPVRRGQQVPRGARSRRVGSTGPSPGPHLHFEVRIGGVARNPRNYL
jgi:hypothetical protein